MEKLIKFIKSNEFGSGETSLSVYNTAWVGRVRHPNKANEPAFPTALKWLRDNQLSDGSWGIEQPFTIFDRMLSTFISVICLKQWNKKDDIERIEKAVNFIKENWEKLIFYERIPWQMPVGFEMVFPTLVEEAKQLLAIEEFGDQKVLDLYVKARDKKIKKIKKAEEKKNKKSEDGEESKLNDDDDNEDGISDLKFWYYITEGLDGELYSSERIQKMVGSDGLVVSSYAVTAFALLKGAELPDSYAVLKHVIDTRGGVPASVPTPIFDLALSLNYLIMAGVDMTNPAIKTQLDKLEKIWRDSNGLVGRCSSLPPDPDVIGSVIHALSATKRISGLDSLSNLLKFYKYDLFFSYEGEHWKERSISVNLNSLLALKNFTGEDKLKKKIEMEKFHKQVQWAIDDTGFDMEDKWHLSKYYCLSRAVFAFQQFDQEYTDICYRVMLHFQNEDGGWGRRGESTPTESAYCILAILNWYKQHGERLESEKRVPPVPALPVIRKAKKYMDETDEKILPLWLEKVPYSLFNVDKTAILAAKYVLEANEHLYKE